MKSRTFQTFLFLMAFMAFDLPLYAQQVDYASLKYGEKLNGSIVVGRNELSAEPNIGVVFFNTGDSEFSATHAILYSGKKHVLLSSVANSTHFRYGNIYIYEEKLIKIFNTNLELISEIDPSNLCEFTRLNANEEDTDFSVEIWILSRDYLLLRCGSEYFINIQGEVVFKREIPIVGSELRHLSITDDIYLLTALPIDDLVPFFVIDLMEGRIIADFSYKMVPGDNVQAYFSNKTQRVYACNYGNFSEFHVFNTEGSLITKVEEIYSWIDRFEPFEFTDFMYVYDESTNSIFKLDINNGTILKKYPISSLFNQPELKNYHLYATRLIDNKYYGIFAHKSDRKNHRYDFTILELNSELNVLDTIKVTNTSFSKIDFNKLLSQNQK